MPPTLASRIQGAIYGIAIADAMSMPVHWFYDPRYIKRDFGLIQSYQAPKAEHPTSIMDLSSTGGAGRGNQQGNIIGDVINHGKKQYWGKPNMHYHRGMKAGENTLNAVTARLLVRTIVANGRHDPQEWLKAYVEFMTTPGSHNDTYAETYHRMFFKNYVAGKKPENCADDDKHNVASAGGLVCLPPPALLAAVSQGDNVAKAVEAAGKAAVTQQLTTHGSAELVPYTKLYAEVLARVVVGNESLKDVAADVARRLGINLESLVRKAGGDDTNVIGRHFSSACYIEHSLPSLLYLAYRYADDPRMGVIANTNVGGENCHRGSALGALLGAANGVEAWPEEWRTGLVAGAEIDKEARDFAAMCERAHSAATGASGGNSTTAEVAARS
jgi:ADP-ribosyl-[dinitrogen reductase] hydrolase